MLWPTGNLSDLRVLMQRKGMKAQEQTAVLAQVESSGAVSGTLAEAGGAVPVPVPVAVPPSEPAPARRHSLPQFSFL